MNAWLLLWENRLGFTILPSAPTTHITSVSWSTEVRFGSEKFLLLSWENSDVFQPIREQLIYCCHINGFIISICASFRSRNPGFQMGTWAPQFPKKKKSLPFWYSSHRKEMRQEDDSAQWYPPSIVYSVRAREWLCLVLLVWCLVPSALYSVYLSAYT